MANTHCSSCGASYALVGYVHRCVGVVKELDASFGPVGATAFHAYRYRDPEKRRAYMRDYMRKRRARA